MHKIYIIAGSFDQYRIYKDKKIKEALNTDNHALGQETQLYTFVSNPDSLRGIQDPHGVFIGTWRSRPDIKEIITNLYTASRFYNQVLIDLLKEFQCVPSSRRSI